MYEAEKKKGLVSEVNKERSRIKLVKFSGAVRALVFPFVRSRGRRGGLNKTTTNLAKNTTNKRERGEAAPTCIVEEERILRLRILDEPLHPVADVGGGRALVLVDLVIGQHDRVLVPEPVVAVEKPKHVARIIDASE